MSIYVHKNKSRKKNFNWGPSSPVQECAEILETLEIYKEKYLLKGDLSKIFLGSKIEIPDK